jgi:hypothetical protein
MDEGLDVRGSVQGSGDGRDLLDDPQARDLFEAIRTLRNTVHGTSTFWMAQGGRPGGRPDETLVCLPPDEVDKLLEIAHRNDWAAQWGLEELRPGLAHVQPDRIVDSFLRLSLAVLDRLMAATPVESLLPNGVEVDGGCGPDVDDGPFSRRNRFSICAQFGFGLPDD